MGFSSGGSSGSIASGSDVALSNPASGQTLVYDGTLGKWKNVTVSSTGTSQLLVVKYASGQYPALPVSQPAGVTLILFKGPVQPTSANISGGMPTYVGDGTNQIMADYEYRALT